MVAIQNCWDDWFNLFHQNNYIGADMASQISSTSFRFASFDRLDLTGHIRHLYYVPEEL